LSIVYESNRVIHIHRNDNNTVTDNHRFFITTKLKNQDNHHRDHMYLLIQNHLGNHFKVLNSHKNKFKTNNIKNPHKAASIKYIISQYLITIHQLNSVVIANHNSTVKIFHIFLGNLRVLKSIENNIIIEIAISVIIRDNIDTSENIKNENIIVNILFTLV
jgi:hypothetical protein